MQVNKIQKQIREDLQKSAPSCGTLEGKNTNGGGDRPYKANTETKKKKREKNERGRESWVIATPSHNHTSSTTKSCRSRLGVRLQTLLLLVKNEKVLQAKLIFPISRGTMEGNWAFEQSLVLSVARLWETTAQNQT